jgi:two-component system NtrC family sensor kinase
LGLRLSVVMLLAAVTVLAFIPLYFAVSTYTELAFQKQAAAQAQSTTRLLLELAQERWSQQQRLPAPEDLEKLVLTDHRVLAFGLYDSRGQLLVKSAGPHAAELPHRLQGGPSEEQQKVARAWLTTRRGSELSLVTVSSALEAEPAERLSRLVALYMGLFALLLWVGSYFALTHLIVRPLGELAHAAGRVATGTRQFRAQVGGAAELQELNQSISTMTEHLFGREESLRKKILEVEEATRNLKEAQARLIRSERLASVGRLSAGLAHEIGNPLSAIMGLQDLMLAGAVGPEEQREFLERMRGETERIHRILRDLLDFARPTNKPQEEEAPGNLSAAVSDTLALLAPQRELRRISIETSIPSDLPEVALSREHLLQVLLNLLLNAADALGEAGAIRIEARLQGRSVSLSVSDNGPGVSKEVAARIFEPFVSTKEVGKGTGLGLSVCRGLVESVGGSISLDESHTDGARFVVELPIAANGY